ncbi:unnamed protein product [Allacma fusca]|uniref:Uncharacterized protein n=1 Tax=Allacma fusca TaxID=39272 RepID=A0A8J2K8Q9_9HEXA|nr:unnamed protein product [Allacma fusca]
MEEEQEQEGDLRNLEDEGVTEDELLDRLNELEKARDGDGGVPRERRYIRNDTEVEEEEQEHVSSLDVEFLKRVLLGKDISPPKNRRTLSCEQSSAHLWANKVDAPGRWRRLELEGQFYYLPFL